MAVAGIVESTGTRRVPYSPIGYFKERRQPAFSERMANATYAQDDASVHRSNTKNNSQPVLNDKYSSDNPSPVIDMPLLR